MKMPRSRRPRKTKTKRFKIWIDEEDDDSLSTSSSGEGDGNGSSGDESSGHSSSDSEYEVRPSTRSRWNPKRVVHDYGSDSSSSGSEINTRIRRSRLSRNPISEDEARNQPSTSKAALAPNIQNEADFASDTSSGSNELLEKCPICLLSFRQQEVGRPEKCDHKFCAQCIHEWSKNVQTCPIDRIEFESIIVFKSYEDQTFTRKIQVDKIAAATSTTIEEDSTQCQICERADREEVMLLCDRCDQGYHMDCLSPPLTAIPAGAWFCDNCFSDEEDDPTENINTLYDDLREMGIPESSLTPASLNAPRVLRTRLNERIQAEIFNQRRYNLRTTTTTEIDITRPSTSREIQMRSVSSVRIARVSTENIMRLRRRAMSIMRRTKKRTKRRRKKPKTKNIVVEYDLKNDQDKKFVSKTKKVTTRRRKTRRTSKKSKRRTTKTTKRRTAKSSCKTVIRVSSTSHEQGSSAPSVIGSHSFSLFGGRNDLDYFDEEEESFENIPTEIEIATSAVGGGIASSIRVSNYRTSSNLLRGKSSFIAPSMQSSSVDVLSDILEMQDKWQNASLDKVEIGKDGKLNLNKASPTKPDRTPENQNVQATEAPMYPRGGGSNFNRGGGNNFRFERGGSRGNYSRHSTGNTTYNNNSGDGGSGSASNFNNNSGGFNNNNNSGGNFNNSFSGFGNNRFNRNNRGGGRNNRNNNFRPRQPPPQNLQTPNSTTQQQSQGPPSLLNLSFPTDMTPMEQNQDQPETVQLLSVPPPPIPPPSFSVPPPQFNSSLQNLSAYGNDDDEGPEEDNHCPNESIYSAETIKIFSQGDNSGDNSQPATSSILEPEKPTADEVDCDEDLVQYDDDEEIPNIIGPQPCPPEDLYSPTCSDSEEIPLPPKDDEEEEPPSKEPFIGPMNYTELLDNIDLPEGDPSDELDNIGLPEGEPEKSVASDADIDTNDAEVQELTKDDEMQQLPVEDKDEQQSKELDRSYTPCLDEKSEVEEEGVDPTPKEPSDKLKDDDHPHNTLEIETELISDDDSLNSMNNKENERGENSRHGKDRDNRQNFKKVKNQRGRNYRSDNQITTGRRRTRSRSRSRSRSSDYRRRRDRRRTRSRSRSNDRYNSRNGRQNKVKRQDIPRYDVRNVINSRPQIDKFGRHTNRRNSQSRSRSRSFSRSRKRRNSRSSSRRNFRRSISISPRRRLSRSPRRLNGGVGKRYSVSPYKNRRSHSISRSLSYSPSRNRRSLSRRSKSPSKHRPVKRKRSREPKKKKRDKNIKKRSHQSNTAEQPWSPSPSPDPELTPPHNSNMMSWTPVTQTPPLPKGGVSKRKTTLKDKKDKKKVKKTDKKEKKGRKKRSEKSTSSPPSKEVFASGNNILVSVSFGNNQSAEQQQQPLQKQQQTTIVTVPPTREEVVSGLLGKRDKKKSKKDKQSADSSSKDNNVDAEQRKSRKKIDAKPVAIIDLERSPFQITQSNSDVIILTDSDGAVDDHGEHEKNTGSIDKEVSVQDQGPQKDMVDDRQFNNNEDDEESQSTTTYGQALLQMGPKTPPEPTVDNSQSNVKFSIGGKKNTVNSRNPLHEEDDQSTASSQPSRRTDKSSNLQQFPSATSPPSQLLPEPSIENISKIGPNTPPDSAPCSPDVYDPFEPTKSPSGSEAEEDRDKSMNSIDHEMDIKNTSLPLNTSTDVDEDRPPTSLDLGLSTSAPSSIPGLQILTNVMISTSGRVNGAGTGSNKSAAGANSSGASGGAAGLNVSVTELLNNSPYSPGSDDYEDLFEPPVDRNKNRQPASSKKPTETFDNLFGSSSPPLAHIKSKSQAKHHSHSKRHHKTSRRNADDMPGSATELMAKDKLIKKLNRHERVVDEVKIVLKPHYMKKHISREDYKEIMKRSIPKIMHSRSGEINPTKIQNLIEAYVRKFRQKNKLNLLTTQGQVSSAVKCAAYLKKL